VILKIVDILLIYIYILYIYKCIIL
jgi:hypothetical protein